MSDLTAEGERIHEALDHASLKLPTGMFADAEAMERAVELGFVEKRYSGATGLMGLSHATLTPSGRAALAEKSGAR